MERIADWDDLKRRTSIEWAKPDRTAVIATAIHQWRRRLSESIKAGVDIFNTDCTNNDFCC